MREGFRHELEQLRLQVEVMAVRVGENVARMQHVLATGDADLARMAVDADDQIDAMHVSLTERTYDLMRREAPVASDLRLLVSVLRIIEELERMGDLSLRVVKQHENQPLLARSPEVFGILEGMAALAVELVRTALDAWAAQDIELACSLTERSAPMDGLQRDLLRAILGLEGEGALRTAVAAVVVGKAIERISDHTVIVGERLRYLLTGDPAHLASEVR